MAWLLLALASACGTVSSRFEPQIQAAVTHADMQRLETEKLILYYPKGTKAEVLRIAKRLEYCRRELEKVTPIKNGPAADKSIFVLPQVPYNNAYVAPPALSGLEQLAVLPQGNTASYFLYFGMNPDPGIIGCHEMVHDMSFRQISGKAKYLHYALGSGSFSPQIGLESWFQEGIAVYYETKIQGRGRLWTKYFEGVFAAGVQEQSINGSFLKITHRKPLFGAQYLVGSHFIDYLARTYGEDKIWDVVGRQSRSILPVFGVGVRFKRSFGKSLSDLIDEFNVYAHKRFPARARPAQQQRVRQLGTMALIGRSADGHVATASEDLDQPLRLFVHAPDGRELISRRLTDVGLGRRLIATGVFAISGLTLTADGRHVYFVALDAGPVTSQSRLMHLDVAKNQLRVIAEDIGGAGGSISSDGTKYYFAKENGDSVAVHVYDVAHHTSKQLTHPGIREYHTYPFVSPDGSRLVVLEGVADAIRPAIYDATTGARLSDVAGPEGATFQPSWSDDQHVVYLASDGLRMQAFETELSTSRYRRLTDAPYVAGAPFFDGKSVQFLNREGWKWTLDQASAEGAGPWLESTTRAVSEGSAAQPGMQEVEVAAAPVAEGSGGEAMPTDAEGATTPATGSTGFAAAPQDTGAAVPGIVAAPPSADTSAAVAVPPVRDPSPTAATPPATDPAGALTGVPQPKATPPAPAEARSEAAAPATPAMDEVTTSHAYFAHRPIDEQEPKIVSDEEDYSIFDGLFVPQGMAPWFAQRAEGQQAIGLGLTGGDRLGLQRWTLLGGWDFNAKLPSGLLSYQNNMMAPYILQIDAEYIGRSEKKLEGFDPRPGSVRIQEVVGSALLSRTWYSSHTAALGGRYVSARYELKDGGDLVLSQRFVGPTLALATSSAESTPYTGRRVAFGLGGVATYYPEALSKADFNMTDLRGAATVVTPLPISRRHTLTLDGRVRTLVGLPSGNNLLQVGGGGNTTLPISLDPDAGPGQQTILPPGLRFFEPLRGFEDYALLGRGALMGEATYTYPFIIDWGTASTLRFLPSIFLRQINLDLFFSAASLLENDRAAALAAGAALKAQVLVWQLPLVFTFQESRRLTYDENFAFYFQVGAQPF